MFKLNKLYNLFILFVFLFISYIYVYSQADTTKVKTGIDVLIESKFAQIAEKKIILLTNHAGRTRNGESSAKILSETSICKLIAIFTPEHGFWTTIPAGEGVDDDTLFNVPVYSLYGKSKSPAEKQLSKCDAVVIDIQDIGIRSYTYLSTVFNTMKSAAKFGKKVIILDRPNPLGGIIVDGNTVEKGKESFVSIIPVSYIHGCTIAELAMMINEEGWLGTDKENKNIKCDLQIIKMQNWKRWMNWEDTGLIWFPTSPHIPTVDAVRGSAMLGTWGELGFISIGIGTSLPFQYIGFPNFDTEEVLNQIKLFSNGGTLLIPSRYRPFYGMYNGKDCNGLLLRFIPNNLSTPYSDGVRLMLSLRMVHPELFNKQKISEKQASMFKKVTGTDKIFDYIFNYKRDEEIIEASRTGLKDFIHLRSKYLLYE